MPSLPVPAWPTPSVTSSEKSAGPRASGGTASIPKRSSVARRPACGSTILMSATPCALAASAAPRPMAPPPSTRALCGTSPRAARPRRTACQRFREGRLFHRNVRRHLAEVAPRDRDAFGEGALARRHRDDLPVGADIVASGPAGLAGAARDQRIYRHAPPVIRPAFDDAGGLAPENQRRGPAVVMAEIGVHVAAADPDAGDADGCVLGSGNGVRHVSELERLGAGVDERLHGPTPSPGRRGAPEACRPLFIDAQTELHAGKVLGEPDVSCPGMPFHALETGDARRRLGYRP